MNNISQIWQKVCLKLRSLLNEDTYERWIATIIPLEIGDKSCTLGVSNEMFSDWLNINYKDLITSVLTEVVGHHLKVTFESGHEKLDVPPSASEKAQTEKKAVKAECREESSNLRYSRRFTFDTFVVGENNRFAHAASIAVSQAPGKTYNPLFIHGATGLGKTHLLQAVAQELLGRRKRARIEYLSSEEFANGYIDALRDRKLPQFRRHYRSLDLLLIDDVQFFKGKEQLQEEFFHTFNALYNAHKQIVLTSDRPPNEIGGLEKRLVSRFEWGLTTDILPPDLETRIAILRKKQADHAVKLNDDILSYVASRIKSNIRRLEGALIRLVSYASVTGITITQDTAEQLLGPLLEEETISSVTVDKIQRTVAEFYDLRLTDMTSKRRPQNIAFPRQIAMYLCRQMTDFSSPMIAEHFNRNHATILHAETSVKNRLSGNAEFRHEVNMLERKIKG